MPAREAKRRVQQWRDDARLLLEDLENVLSWILEHSSVVPSTSTGPSLAEQRQFDISCYQEGIDLIGPIDEAVLIYCKQVPHSRISAELLQPHIAALQEGSETWQHVTVPSLDELQETVKQQQRAVSGQEKHKSDTGCRSEQLKATIEVNDQELIIRTDDDGSVKLRGSTHIPLFLALWNAPGHRLSRNSFLDVDRSVRETHLVRHRNRLAGILQDIMLEIVTDPGGMQLKRQRRQ